MTPKPITIIGGGLAGLTLGIGLRQRGVPVILWEAGSYPRHRVCGEFISGRGQNSLQRLGLLGLLHKISAGEATTAAFFSEKSQTGVLPLPSPALCISRFVLDATLAQEFERLGGELRLKRWTDGFGEGCIRATGRRIRPSVKECRYFGLKVHVKGLKLSADLEMHFVPQGYVGLSRVGEDVVNVCGLFRTQKTEPTLARNWLEWVQGPENSILRSRFADSYPLKDSFCSVAGFSFERETRRMAEECCIGDSIAMIPPFTGNGMSMAFESAELAISPLETYARSETTWEEAKRAISAGCKERFRGRLRWANYLQSCLFYELGRKALFFAAKHSPFLWKELFTCTR